MLQSEVVFRLVAVLEARHLGPGTAMDADGCPNTCKNQFQTLEVKPRLVVLPKAPATIRRQDFVSGNNPACTLPVKVARKRVGFSLDLPRMMGKRPQADEDDLLPNPVHESLEGTEIESLCSRLSQLAPEHRLSCASSSPCLGYLSGADDYRYMIYKTSQADPKMRNRSLQELLQSESKELRLTVRNRLELAFTLALSLLQLHSSPWITKRLRSRDVVLFHEDKQKWSPYLAAAFNAMREGPFSKTSMEITGSDGSKLKSSPIFSFGVVLLEIGRSRLLLEANPSETGVEVPERDTAESEMRERLEACTQVLKRTVAMELGPRYQNVVGRCILWEEEEDLSVLEVQKSFCEKVVCELDICLTKFDEQ
jgi:hypothetical protein